MVALAQARGTLKSIISAVHTIQQLKDQAPASLMVGGIMKKLKQSHDVAWQSFTVFHMVTWSYDDANLPESLPFEVVTITNVLIFVNLDDGLVYC